jgi:predicted AlkP superfamily phosphohydrolase/phosphomutase
MKPLSRCARPFLALALSLALPASSAAWGFVGHRTVNRRAIETLPPELRPLFEANADYVSEHAIDPDLWRGAGAEGEDPNHFLDMDAFGTAPPFPEIPRTEEEHLRRHGKDAREKGRVPWRAGEIYRELVAAFRTRDAARVLDRAAVLGHYVGDAHVPLHAVLNYDGQLSNQRGVHNRWESGLVERFERQLAPRVQPRPETGRLDPVLATFDALLESFQLASAVLEADKAEAGPADLATTPEDDRYDEGYFSRYFAREGDRVAARMTRAAERIGGLWRQAWEDAGRPPLPASFQIPYVRKSSKAVLVSIDGGAAWVLDDAVRRGVMPRLAAVRAAGASGRMLAAMPPKTAAGHASLYTGAWSDRHGIVGNEVPVPGGTVLEANTGYGSTHLRAEPIWVTAARQGLNASLVSATQVYPFAPFTDDRRFGGNYWRGLVLFDGYQSMDAEDKVYHLKDVQVRPVGAWLGPLPAHTGEVREVEVPVEGARLDGLLYDDPADPTAGFDTLYLGFDRDPAGGITLKPAPLKTDSAAAFASVRVKVAGGESAVFFRLWTLAPDGSELTLYRTPVHVLRALPPRLDAPALEASGGFVGNGASYAYADGKLGPQLWHGGDGTAERRYLETVALVIQQFRKLTDFTFDKTAWDLLLTYIPYPDEALHRWLGVLDPSTPGHDPAQAARLQPFMDEALRAVDGFIGYLADRTRGTAVLAVGTDHGMQGVSRVFRPNAALAAAGLLTPDGRGWADLGGTQAVYFRGNAGSVLINTTDRPGGIVAPAQEAEVRLKVIAALKAVRDPQTGKPVVADVLESRPGQEPALPPGTLHLSLAPGYELSASVRGDVVGPLSPVGSHRVDPQQPFMHGAFVIAGPGVAPGVDLGHMRQIDVAPTICALLGIDPPAHATGTVLHKALGRPLPSAAAARGRHAP